MPVDAGIASRRWRQASSPPAEAPIPTIGKSLLIEGGPRASNAFARGTGPAAIGLLGCLFGMARLSEWYALRLAPIQMSRIGYRSDLDRDRVVEQIRPRSAVTGLYGADLPHEETRVAPFMLHNRAARQTRDWRRRYFPALLIRVGPRL